MAWILLIGFALLLINLMTFRFYWEFSLIVYITIGILFLFMKKKD